MSGRVTAASQAPELASRLAQQAEAVCRCYLGNGRRVGRYWRVGDIANTPGESLYVRLCGVRAGKWVDAATGEHGDLLDLLACAENLPSLAATLDAARRFLALPHGPAAQRPGSWPRAASATEAAQRMFRSARPIKGTLAQTYLRHRGITAARDLSALRYHPTCFYRADDAAPCEARPALLAAVTDLEGRITGVQRTWLAPSGDGKAPVPAPRRALGHLLGNAVRFGAAADILIAGEGIETVLSLRSVMPSVPMVAALSASHLAALVLPAGLRRLYIACDADAAGWRAFQRLAEHAREGGIDALPLHPSLGDFNDDLCTFGSSHLLDALRTQIALVDQARMLARPLP